MVRNGGVNEKRSACVYICFEPFVRSIRIN
jgi:hypothetical protein